MRTIKYIAVHCTAGNQRATVADLMAEFRRKGWKHPGYHYLVTADGAIHQLLDDAKVSNGVKGWNYCTVNVAYTGGVDTSRKSLPPTDNRTAAQKAGMASLVRLLRKRYPQAVVQGHRDFPGGAKACPSFDVAGWLREIGMEN